MAKIKVALVSCICRIADVEYNMDNLKRWIGCAANESAEFICFPEMNISGYGG